MNTLTLNTTSTAYKNTSILFLAFLIFFFTHSPLQAAAMNVDNGFESGNLNGMTCSGNCPKVNTGAKLDGKYGGDFELTPGMSTNYRTEVEGIQYFSFGQEYWFGFKYRYEDWVKDSSSEIAPFQIHDRPSSWDAACNSGSAVATAPFLMMSQNDQVQFRTYGGKVMWSAPIQKKQWLGIVVRFKISSGSDGFIEAWKDGVKLGRVDGANYPKLDKCGVPMRTPYFKMGVYKWDWKRKATDSTRRQLFIDNLKIAQGTDAYSMVSSTPTTTPPTTAEPVPVPVPTPPPPPPHVNTLPSDHYRINAGGSAVSDWAADAYYNTGRVATFDSIIDMSDPSLSGITPQMALFQMERWDHPDAPELRYSFAVNPGSYEVRLYFAETYSGTQSVGARKFDVLIEGELMMNDYDVFADVGANKGVMKSFIVTSDNSLDIDF
ncbi:MAG: heparin lyase I family protein, partial [Gammaproteobacteria bacterium]